MNRKLTFLMAAIYALLLVGIQPAAAIPAYPYPITVTQSDGTRLTIQLFGDEYNHYTLTKEGYTVVSGPNNDYYFAKMGSDGSLVPTNVMAKPTNRLSANDRAIVSKLPKGIRSIGSNLQRAPRASYPGINSYSLGSSVGGNQAPGRISDSKTTGEFHSLVLLVDFKDTKFTVPDAKNAFSRLLNDEGYSENGSTGSARDYYVQNSGGKFTPTFDVKGPFTVSERTEYYSGKNSTERIDVLIQELCTIAEKEGVDFSQYADEKGVIRDVFFFFAGYSAAEGNGTKTIWPHRSTSSVGYGQYNGAQLYSYACTSEYRGYIGSKKMASIGAFSHEFGHILGWPDFYDSNSGTNGLARGPERFSLMAMGCYNNEQSTPPALNILERWMVGWADPEEFSQNQTYQIPPITDNKGYIMATGNTNEYFMAEYRGAGKNVWDDPQYASGTGTGLIVYHIDYTPSYVSRWIDNNTVNGYSDHECMKLVMSDPKAYSETNEDVSVPPYKVLFPGTNKVTALNKTSNTMYNVWKAPSSDKIDVPISFKNIVLDPAKGYASVDVERLGGPGISFKADAYQTEALLTWKDSSTDKWTVSWTDAKGNKLGEENVTKSEFLLSKLMPSTTYRVTISGTPASGEKWSQTFDVVTKSRLGSNARIGFNSTEFSKDTPILLTLMDYQGTYTSIEWSVDGKVVTSNYVTLPSGAHTIKAVVKNKEGNNEYLIKYMTVK